MSVCVLRLKVGSFAKTSQSSSVMATFYHLGSLFRCYSVPSVVRVCFDNDVIWCLTFLWKVVDIYLTKNHMTALFSGWTPITQNIGEVRRCAPKLSLLNKHQRWQKHTSKDPQTHTAHIHTLRLTNTALRFLHLFYTCLLPTEWSQGSRLYAAVEIHSTHCDCTYL